MATQDPDAPDPLLTALNTSLIVVPVVLGGLALVVGLIWLVRKTWASMNQRGAVDVRRFFQHLVDKVWEGLNLLKFKPRAPNGSA